MRQTTHLKDAQTTEQPPGSTVVMPRLWESKTACRVPWQIGSMGRAGKVRRSWPKFIKLGRHVRYKAEDVWDWIEENARTCTREGS